MSKSNEITFKLITLGNSGVGKTSIIKRYVYNIFETDNMATIGINFSFKELTLKNGKKVKLKLIDTAGEEKYQSLSKSYYKNAEGVLFVFDLSEIRSFNNISEWIKAYNEYNNDDKIPRYLIGNKCELDSKVDDKLIDEFLKQNTNYTYKKISAAQNIGVDELFLEIAEKMSKNYKVGKQQGKTLHLKEEFENNNNRKSNCQICSLQNEAYQ
jgi:Ras-related protein Rab-8A